MLVRNHGDEVEGVFKTLREYIRWWWWLPLPHAMEGCVRDCMLEVSHDNQREVGVEFFKCRSKSDEGLFKQRGGVGGI